MLTMLLANSVALACGGFFCNNDEPVEQTGEDIVFAVADGKVTVHVQVAYTGPSEDFAWIVPVPGNPEIETSTIDLFTAIEEATRPAFLLESIEDGDCWKGGYYNDYASSSVDSSASSSPAPEAGGGTVDVVSKARVGPYATVTLKAESSEGLLDWLQENGYDLPDQLSDALDPYIAGDAHFVALKLQKDKDVGDLTPIALSYDGDAGMIPIQLTSVAATPDMRLRVYMLGEHRAVPESYLHVKINDLAIDWFSWENRYEEAITIAADEAGGHAFATDFSGEASRLDQRIYDPSQYDLDSLADAAGPQEWVEGIMSQGFSGSSKILEIFQEFIPLPPSLVGTVEDTDFYNCLACYFEHLDEIDFDAEAATAALDERIVAPRREAQELVDAHPHLSRLTSSLSPAEMTVDPVFVFNADMEQDVNPVHVAQQTFHCRGDLDYSTAPRTLSLPDGREITIPSYDYFWNNGTTEWEYLAELRTVYASTVEETGRSGPPTVMFDYTAQGQAEVDAFNAAHGGLTRTVEGSSEDPAKIGCGCNQSAPAASLLLPFLGMLARRRS